MTTYRFDSTSSATLLGPRTQTNVGWPYGLADASGMLGAVTGYPAMANAATKVYASKPFKGQAGTGTVVMTLPKGSKVIVSAMQGGWSRIPQGWVESRFLAEDPAAIPSDGVQMLQQSLTDLAALGHNTNPGAVNGVVDAGTVRAFANALSIVAGDIKGGAQTATIIGLALNAALISGKVDAKAQGYVRQYAKTMAIAVQIYLAKKRGEAGAGTDPGGFFPGAQPKFWTTQNIAIAAGGTAIALTALYVVLKK